jgi:hypothetical protein
MMGSSLTKIRCPPPGLLKPLITKAFGFLSEGNLGSIRLLIQIDIGFGDVIVPKPSRVSYPVLLDFPAPILNGYTMESTIAEKFQAMVKLGLLSSRMKDFYDIWFLSRSFDFKSEILLEALEETFKKRNTPIINEPTIFDASFMNDGNKQSQWMGFIDRVKLDGAPKSFSNVATDIKLFLQPVIVAIINRQTFKPF